MERVTQWFGDETHGREAGLADKYDGVYLDDELIQVLLNRLATYEDTGMTPEEIKGADEFLKENWEMPLERLVEGMELIMAKDSGRLVVLPCRVGDTVYRIIDDCMLAGDCGTKRRCRGCDYRNVFVEEDFFCLSLMGNDGHLKSGYYLTREEAETAVVQMTQ